MSGEQVILEVPVQSDQSGAIDDETQESSEVPSLIGVADSIEDSVGADVTALDSDALRNRPAVRVLEEVRETDNNQRRSPTSNSGETLSRWEK